jgi:hypothetical protein
MACACAIAFLSRSPVFAQDVRIAEFLASNVHGLLDEDGDASDWVELENVGEAINLNGWYLTDDRMNLAKWRFPATDMAAHGRLLIFASGKNRAVASSQLHLNFALNAAGGYLALVRPDRVTIASGLRYGRQFADVSFGVGLGPSYRTEGLVPDNAPVRYLVVTEPVDENWRGAAPFDDSSWSNGVFSLGFDAGPKPTTVAYVVPTNTPGNQAYAGAIGMDFDVLTPIEIVELGCFDDGGNGIASGVTITVRLWRRNNAGTPNLPTDDTGIAVAVSTNFTAGLPGTLIGGHRFKALPVPILLTNGSYTIVASGYGAAERLANLVGGASLVTPEGGDAIRFVRRERITVRCC